MKYVVIILFVAFCFAFSQNDTTRTEEEILIDSLWDLEDFDPAALDSVWNLEDLDESDYYEYELENQYSKGWFPKILVNPSSFSIFVIGGTSIDAARDIRSEHFYPTAKGFSDRNPLSAEEGEFRESFSENEDTKNLIADMGRIGITYSFSKFLPFITDVSLSYFSITSALYSVSENKQFLRDGELVNLKEAAGLFFKDHGVSAAIKFALPIYGAFVSTDGFYSIYTFNFGLVSAYIVDNNVIQHYHILNNKETIRYSGGEDTYRVIDNEELPNTVKFRNFLEFGVGFRFGDSSRMFNYSIDFGIPLQNVVDDAEWKQYYWGFKFNIGF